MAKKKAQSNGKTAKPKGKPFKPGQSGNPGGRKKIPADIRAARELALEEALRTIIATREMTVKEASKMNMETLPLGKRAILVAYMKLDFKTIKDLEDRLWGKATETVQLLGKDGETLFPKPQEIIEEYKQMLLQNGKVTK